MDWKKLEEDSRIFGFELSIRSDIINDTINFSIKSTDKSIPPIRSNWICRTDALPEIVISDILSKMIENYKRVWTLFDWTRQYSKKHPNVELIIMKIDSDSYIGAINKPKNEISFNPRDIKTYEEFEQLINHEAKKVDYEN